jgi:hypothetical protein
VSETKQMQDFDFNAMAEVFPSTSRRGGRRSVGYRRFDNAADAIRFVVEDLPPMLQLGVYLEVNEERYDSAAIRQLYDSPGFPRARR